MIALTGYGLTSAAGPGVEAARRAIDAGAAGSCIAPLPDRIAALLTMHRGAVFPPAEHAPGEAPSFDPAVCLEQAFGSALAEALDMAGVARIERRRGPLFVGTALGGVDVFEAHAESGVFDGGAPLSTDLVEHAAKVHDLAAARGAVHSATCASALYALEEACLEVESGRSAFAVCGGFDVLSRFMQTGFHTLGALHDEADEDGLILGEAACFLVIETLENALSRNASVHGVLVGRGICADAYHLTAPDETARGMIEAVHACLRDAGRTAQDVDSVSLTAHGSRRYAAMYDSLLLHVFGPEAERRVVTTSWEPSLGHVLAATGALGIAHAAMRLAAAPDETAAMALAVGFGGQNGAHLLVRPETVT